MITFLSGDLPRQSSVYVVFSKQQEAIHVLSLDVSAKYSIVRAMRPELIDQIAENESGNGRVPVGDGLFATPQQHMLLQHIDEMMRSDYYQGNDKVGFYNGVPGRTIISRFCPESLIAGVATFDQFCPYNRYHLPQERLRDIMGSIPDVQDSVHGPVESSGIGGEGKFAVSMNQSHFSPSPYIIAKLDRLCCLHEHQFHDEYVFCEKMLSSAMNHEDLERVRNSAVNIMGLLANRRTGSYVPIDPLIKQIIGQSLACRWTIHMHDHIVID